MWIEKDREAAEKRIAELIEERDEYDKRRRETMEISERWRTAYHSLAELEGKPIISPDVDVVVKNSLSSGDLYLVRAHTYEMDSALNELTIRFKVLDIGKY